ncbi:MAG: hypothetical protein K8F92_17905 [Hyphomicrobium sp.]|uniref:hypothetical protein n=1 Tax=Hyphomicrobium sp. TaxID=82 RepID=UPI001325AA67|nr:hypothetical protein [Hyphomicrobium sp.]KAB2938408.1 MAG: hypothetical protein F9K20_18780 [Hyphomicrobium sp.]MBZ0211501.1 hypothetical protein [Hyphomicrobium sp.]
MTFHEAYGAPILDAAMTRGNAHHWATPRGQPQRRCLLLQQEDFGSQHARNRDTKWPKPRIRTPKKSAIRTQKEIAQADQRASVDAERRRNT